LAGFRAAPNTSTPASASTRACSANASVVCGVDLLLRPGYQYFLETDHALTAYFRVYEADLYCEWAVRCGTTRTAIRCRPPLAAGKTAESRSSASLLWSQVRRPDPISNSIGRARSVAALACILGMAGIVAGGSEVRQQTSEECPQTTRSYDTLFRPGEQQSIVSERGNTTVSLKRDESCPLCPAGERFLFEVKDSGSGSTSEFTLANHTAQVDEVQVLSSTRTAVIGRMQQNLSVVSILDHRQGTLVDDFYCLRPSVSDGGRFVAYVKVYPLHFTPGVSSQYLIYDVSRTPAENRPGKFDGVMYRVNVGFPVYPFGSKNLPGDNYGLPDSEVHQCASPGLFWFRDDRVLAFADRFDGSVSLVWVDLGAGVSNPNVTTIPLDTQSIVDLANCPGLSDKSAWGFRVDGMLLSKDSERTLEIQLGTSAPECLRTNKVDVIVPR